MEIIVALGANLGEREATFDRALLEFPQRIGLVTGRSRNYETAPLVMPGVDPETVPTYLNAVVLVETELTPRAVLNELLAIERLCGRDRSSESCKWSSRNLDLDLVAVENMVISEESLEVPHPRMHERLFVLEPMAELRPDWQHPHLKLTVQQLLAELRMLMPLDSVTVR